MKDNHNITEHELDNELHGLIDDMPENMDLASGIEKIINKKIRKIVFHFEVMYPYNEVASLQIEKVGFSRYILDMQIIDHRGPVMIGKPNVKIEIFQGKCKVKEDINSIMMQRKFLCLLQKIIVFQDLKTRLLNI